MQITVKAYAKINFVLNVLGTRPDGYHEVETVMQAVSLCDDVTVSWESAAAAAGLTIELAPGREDLPAGSGNLAWRAAARMHETFLPDVSGTVRIQVTKRIPVAAGLAGGSADGAAVINALACLWHIADEEKLLSIGASMGADIPFCIMAQRGRTAALGTGTGTELQYIRPTLCRVVLTTPHISVSTKAVYGELKDSDCGRRADVTPFTDGGSLPARLMTMCNHLQSPCLRLFPEIGDVFRRHRELFPAALRTQLSGSGPTVFSVFPPDTEITVPSSFFSDFSTIVCDTVV